MDGSGLFVSSCSRRQLARRRAGARSWRGRYLRWRDYGGRWKFAGVLLTGGTDLFVLAVVAAGAAAYVAGRGWI